MKHIKSLLVGISIGALSVLTPVISSAAALGCAGTYYVVESGGAESIWTIHNGLITGASSVQQSFNFSNQVGSYAQDGSGVITGNLYDFSYQGKNVSQQLGSAVNFARIDFNFSFPTSCSSGSGSYKLSFNALGDTTANGAQLPPTNFTLTKLP